MYFVVKWNQSNKTILKFFYFILYFMTRRQLSPNFIEEYSFQDDDEYGHILLNLSDGCLKRIFFC